MSKKLIVLLTALVLLCAAALIPQDHVSVEPVVYQHLSWPGQSAETTGLGADGELSTHLPLIILHTDGNVVPGVNVSDQRELFCDWSIIHNENGVNRSTDAPTQQGRAAISIRGNSSRRFVKKQYSIRTLGQDGLNADVPLLGMPAHSAWVLNGSFIDRAIIRNYMLYNICGEFMEYAPRSRMCEVMLTDADHNVIYQGVYTLMEKPKVDEVRLPLVKYDPKYTATSFLVQMNSHIDKHEIAHLKPDELMAYSFDLEYPGMDEITPQSLDYVEREMLTFEKLLYDADYTGNWAPVLDAIDMESFVDYYLINEFFQNYDAGIRSTYLYRNLGGKYRLGPVWDFDGTFNNFNALHFKVSDMNLKTTYFYYYLSQCPEFAAHCASRYRELRNSVLNEEYLLTCIDQCVEYLGDAGDRNYALWYPDSASSFSHYVENMKEFVCERGAWLDEHFQRISTVMK